MTPRATEPRHLLVPALTRAAVDWLHARYGSADRVGRFGFFRPGLPRLWSEAADWLADR